MQARQGDVFLVRIDPREVTALRAVEDRDPRGVVLALGEATGHAHVVVGESVALFEGQLQREVGRAAQLPRHARLESPPAPVHRFLRVEAPAVLRHEEHGAVELDPGLYRVVRQREYTPAAHGRLGGWQIVGD